MLFDVLGVPTDDVKRLAVPLTINNWNPINVLHPLLVLESRCSNLERIESKRTGNGVTQAKVACIVVQRYIEDCLASSSRRREALKAARRIASLAKSNAGLYVWKNWGIDVMKTIDDTTMPGQFSRSWTYEMTKVESKREIVSRNCK